MKRESSRALQREPQCDSAAVESARRVVVVEGGGLRGAFCAGALAALDRSGLERPDLVFATSAGAPSAAYLVTGQIDRAVQLWENRTHTGHLVSPLHWFKRRPLMDVDKLVDCFRGERPLETSRFDTVPHRVFITVTECQSGLPHYVRMTSQNAFSLLTAGMALPLAYGQVVEVDGKLYIDGGITDSIPIRRALEESPEEILVILTRPKGYQKRRSRAAEQMFAMQYRRYPALVDAFLRRSELYNETLNLIDELEEAGRVSVLRPTHPLPASRMTRDRRLIMETIQIGRDVARQWLRARSLFPAR